jgi:SulP family sulfate permease
MHALFLVIILALGSGFVQHIPIPALAGVTAWMGLCLLDWSAWRRLPKMSRLDAAAFLVTAFAVMSVNAVLAVTIGCSLYVFRWVYGLWARDPGAPARRVETPLDPPRAREVSAP